MELARVFARCAVAVPQCERVQPPVGIDVCLPDVGGELSEREAAKQSRTFLRKIVEVRGKDTDIYKTKTAE